MLFRNIRCTFESSSVGRLPPHSPRAGRVTKQPRLPPQHPLGPALAFPQRRSSPRHTDHAPRAAPLCRSCSGVPARRAAHSGTQHQLLGGPTSPSLKITASEWPQVQFQLLCDAFQDIGTSGKARSKWKANKLANNRETASHQENHLFYTMLSL